MQALTEEELQAIIESESRVLWGVGDLRFKLHRDQRIVYQAIAESQTHRFVLEIARRWGKTWLLCCIAIEACLGGPKRRVVYGAPTIKDLEEFIIPTIEAICEDAPPECRPKFNAATGHFDFPNGSYIHLFGCDDKRKANRGRGAGAYLAIIDEAGFIGILRYVVRSIVRPQLLHSGGKLIIGSTPAEEPDHDFTAMAERAEARGNYASRTIHDNPLLTRARIAQFIEEDAKEEGLSAEAYMDSDDFRREYLAERVINKLLVVLPEWEKKRASLIQAVPRPEFFDGLEVLDYGGNDPHAALFGYWHFALAKWVIEDELLLRDGENTKQLADALKAKEKALWGTAKWEGTLFAFEQKDQALWESTPEWMRKAWMRSAPRQPRTRWADNDIQLCRDLYELHGMAFIPTAKDDLQLQVNRLRLVVNADEVLLHPRCEHTDRHWRGTTWENHKRRGFARRAGEHGDLLACGIYGARNLDRQHNPYPPGHSQSPRKNQLSAAQRLGAALRG